jgi:L-aspartate oxidase
LKQAHELHFDGRLLSVDSRRVPLYRFDILVIGSGAAGASAALAAADRGAEVALIAKGDLNETNTLYAQGGVAAVLDRADSIESHVDDTLRVGCGLAELERVARVVRGGPAAIERLRRLGAAFDTDALGGLALEREGGHSHRRIVHAHGDATGRAVQETLRDAVQEHARITTFLDAFVLDLLCAPGGRVVGALVELSRGDLAVFSGGQVILATGGAGQIYRETTNPTIATGDGVAIAFRAGAALRDLEFYQFHPTMLYIAGAARVLISEIVRGAGGVLRDRQGARFMSEYHEAADLAPRDVVSRAIFERMVATRDTNVYLDLSAVRGDPHQLFPGISRICRFFGIDIATDPVPVRPGAHYSIGGVEVDGEGRTTVPGLWAVGECASSGLHGANRMGSNSLLECLVLGAAAGEEAAVTVRDRGIHEFEVRPPRDRATAPAGMKVNVQDVIYSLKSLMWRQLGIEREAPAMEDARTKILLWTRAVQELAPQDRTSWECLNMLTVSHLMAVSAAYRRESRGVHYRTDFPHTDPAWRAHTRVLPRFDDGRIVEATIERVSVAAPAAARA